MIPKNDTTHLATDVTCYIQSPDKRTRSLKFTRGTLLHDIKATLVQQMSDDLVLFIYDHKKDDMVVLKHAAQLCTSPIVMIGRTKNQLASLLWPFKNTHTRRFMEIFCLAAGVILTLLRWLNTSSGHTSVAPVPPLNVST